MAILQYFFSEMIAWVVGGFVFAVDLRGCFLMAVRISSIFKLLCWNEYCFPWKSTYLASANFFEAPKRHWDTYGVDLSTGKSNNFGGFFSFRINTYKFNMGVLSSYGCFLFQGY